MSDGAAGSRGWSQSFPCCSGARPSTTARTNSEERKQQKIHKADGKKYDISSLQSEQSRNKQISSLQNAPNKKKQENSSLHSAPVKTTKEISRLHSTTNSWHMSSLHSSASNKEANTMKVWVDTDAGTDDAQALLMLLAPDSPASVVGVSCVDGNTSLDNVVKNVFRVVTLCDQLGKVPIYAGSKMPLLGPQPNCSYHGQDGMGDRADLDPQPLNSDKLSYLVRKEPACTAIVDAAKEHMGELTVIALGPLTNIALALRIDPDFGKLIKELHIMGGNVYGESNVAGAAAEFNFHKDPEAAHVVLSEVTCPTWITPWETTLRQGHPWKVYDEVVNQGSVKADFIKQTDAASAQKARKDFSHYICCDQVATAVALDRGLATRVQAAPARVSLAAGYTRGMMLVDWAPAASATFAQRHPVNLVLEYDVKAFQKMWKNALK